MRTSLCTLFVAVAFLWVLPQAASAQELVGARARALQGGRASPADNAAIYLNPAGVGMFHRYDFSAFGSLEQGGGEKVMNLSIVDSKSSSELGAGIGWNRVAGDHLPRDDFGLAVAQKYAKGSFGVAGRYRIDRERERRSDLNMDTGFVVDPYEGKWRTAFVSYNVFSPPKGVDDVHRKFGAGLASRWLDLFELVADAAYTLDVPTHRRWEWAAGTEVTPIPQLAVRGAYGQSPAGRDRVPAWTAGVGAGTPAEFNFAYTYRHPMRAGHHPSHAAELSLFFF